MNNCMNPGGDTPLFGLYGDVPLDRVWFFGPVCDTCRLQTCRLADFCDELNGL